MKALHLKLLRDLWRLGGQVFAIALVMASGIGVLVMSPLTQMLQPMHSTRRRRPQECRAHAH